MTLADLDLDSAWHGLATDPRGLSTYQGNSSLSGFDKFAPGIIGVVLPTMTQGECLEMHRRQHHAEVDGALAKRESYLKRWTPERRAKQAQSMKNLNLAKPQSMTEHAIYGRAWRIKLAAKKAAEQTA